MDINKVICLGKEGFACSLAWLVLVVIFFIAMIIRKQCDDGALAGVGYNVMGALIGGFGVAIILTIIFTSFKWALIGGIAGVLIGGFVAGRFFDSNE